MAEILKDLQVTSSPRTIAFSRPLKSISIPNDGTSNLYVKFGESPYHNIKPYETVDLDLNGATNMDIYSDTTSTFRAIGTYERPAPTYAQVIPSQDVTATPQQPMNENKMVYLLAFFGFLFAGLLLYSLQKDKK
jgi:hypothetical protein